MSVINQMLRDLEQRKAKDSAAAHYVDEVNIIAKRQFDFRWLILAIIIVCILGVFLSLSSVKKMSPGQVIDKQDVHNAEIQKSALINLPNELSEIKKPIANVIDTPLPADSDVNLQSQAQPVIKKKAARPVMVKGNIDTKKGYKQTSVKSEPFFKPEVEIKRNKEEKITEPSKESSKEIKRLPEAAVVVKVPVKSSVKSVVNKKTTRQVVYQARQLMTTNQTAAIQLLEDNLKEVSPNADYYSLLANLQQRRQKYDNAIIYYRKALEIAPQKGELWIGIALAYRGTGEEDNAVQAFKQALLTDEISSELRNYAVQQISSHLKR